MRHPCLSKGLQVDPVEAQRGRAEKSGMGGKDLDLESGLQLCKELWELGVDVPALSLVLRDFCPGGGPGLLLKDNENLELTLIPKKHHQQINKV